MSIMKYAPEALLNLFRPPVTTKYPAEPYEYPEKARGHIEIVIDECIGCGMCVRCCPSGALAVDKLKGTWTIDRFNCIACGYCVTKCPKKCLSNVAGYQEPMGEKTSVTYTKSPEQLAAEEQKRKEAAEKAAAAKAAKEAAGNAAAGNAAAGNAASGTAANESALDKLAKKQDA